MPPFKKPTLVTLRRQNPNQAWGFRLGGGAEIGEPFQIQKVTPNSLAYLGGLSENDELVRIGNISLRGLTHDEVQQIILRCINCIDLFILRDDGQDIQPRIDRGIEILNEHSDVPYLERPEHFSVMQTGNAFKPPFHNNVQQPTNQTVQSYQIPAVEDISGIKTSQVQFQMNPVQKVYIVENGKTDSNTPSSPFDPNSPLNKFTKSKTIYLNTRSSDQTESEPEPSAPEMDVPRQPDNRVFGVNPRSSSRSPIRYNHLTSAPSTPSNTAMKPNFPSQQITQQNYKFSQSTPTTPTATNQGFFENDSNNNPIGNEMKKVYGLQNREVIKPIEPIGNHGVQPMTNEKKYFGINHRQRLNSLTDRDWKEALPIVNIPNTDQLLPSHTRQMQTYINQSPPTEKNLRPSLAGIQRRKIRPVWPPPLPKINKGSFAEGRDSPNSRAYNWPPSRAQSVDRDFGYGERSASPFQNYGRVLTSTRVWPPPSNATPAGRSGFIPDENDNENYAYNLSRDTSPAPGWIASHIPSTYRPPPEMQLTQVIQDF